MDKIPVTPPDPAEVRLPVEGVDAPDQNDPQAAVHAEGDGATSRNTGEQRAYSENEGLVKQKAREAAGSVEGADGAGLDAATEAAQRGRTA
jgi:hypothetical protein